MPQKAAGKKKTPAKRKWVAKVKTASTFPPEGLFTKDAAAIAKSLLRRKYRRKDPRPVCGC
jgi:hypothetical protein